MTKPKRIKVNFHKKFTHPETREGEVLICYTDESGYKKLAWKTKRKGVKVIDYYNILELSDDHKLFPVFIQKEELDEYKTGKFEKKT